MADLQERLAKIKLLLMDCDGVLTDGRLYYGPLGEEQKVFHVRDGFGLVSWHAAGLISGIISGRNSPIVQLRFQQLGVTFIRQGNDEKEPVFDEILNEAGVTAEQTAYIGDDEPDIPVMRRAGLAVTVADAHSSVKEAAHFVTDKSGGQGAVRELIDLILGSRDRVTKN
jgi:3-deoxy-D-manno-octulosonate 8-phosphate phosphatase (KDO 8-P phosphatase)